MSTPTTPANMLALILLMVVGSVVVIGFLLLVLMSVLGWLYS